MEFKQPRVGIDTIEKVIKILVAPKKKYKEIQYTAYQLFLYTFFLSAT